MYNYGYCLFYGKINIHNKKSKAIHYYEMAAEKGNIDAMDQCSKIFYYGKGVPIKKKDFVILKWLQIRDLLVQ